MPRYFKLVVFICLLATQEILNELSADRNCTKRSPKKRLAILVPFRDRYKQLQEFVPHMYKFLRKKCIPFRIFVIEQTDTYRFNRGSLINVGYLETRNKFDYIAIHDVDLLPLNSSLSYSYPETNPVHISAPKRHPVYRYAEYVGGVLLIKREHFELVEGMANRFWGGGEDEEFYWRLWDAGLRVRRVVGSEDTFRHISDEDQPRRVACEGREPRPAPARARAGGVRLRGVAYTLRARRRAAVRALPVTLLVVALQCDRARTPWCECPDKGA